MVDIVRSKFWVKMDFLTFFTFDFVSLNLSAEITTSENVESILPLLL